VRGEDNTSATKTLIHLNSSAHQRSNFGLLLSLIFINDVVIVVENSGILLYADDLKIFRAIKNDEDCIHL